MTDPPVRLWIEAAAGHSMRAEADRAYPNESGGLLLGYWSDDGTGVVVEQIVGPGPKAVHRPTRFVPDEPFQRQALASAYEAAGRRIAYLGDWHTHPNGPPTLSRTDQGTLGRIARAVRQRALKEQGRADRPALMLLLSGPPWRVTVSTGRYGDAPWWRPAPLVVRRIAQTHIVNDA